MQAPDKNQINAQKWLLLGILFLLLLGLMTVSIHWVLSANTLGPDFYTFWVAGRAVFIDGINPYDSQVTLQSQMGIYGRPALPGEDQVAFAYPLYSLFLVLPTVWMSIDWAQAFWLVLNLLVSAGILLFVGRRSPKGLALSSLVFYPVVFGLILGNFAVLIGMFLLLFFSILSESSTLSLPRQIAFGVILAWMTAKPQFVWLFILFIILLAWRRKLFALLVSFICGAAAWISLSFLLAPHWLPDWIRRIGEYAGYVESQPVLTGILSNIMPAPISLVLTLIIAAVCLGFTIYWLRLWWLGRVSMLGVIAWLGLVTYLFHPHGIAYEQIAFIFPFTLSVGSLSNRWNWKIALLWCVSILLTWAGFVLGRFYFLPTDPLPVLLYAVWLLWFLPRSRQSLSEADLRTSAN